MTTEEEPTGYGSEHSRMQSESEDEGSPPPLEGSKVLGALLAGKGVRSEGLLAPLTGF